ncbi:MAG: TIGR04283 family arsenosugar biosynthesis glycosyltransferase [Cyanobacterium sp. T60_A2020_053]|nr:TIGR04283 family arsenosugar biosynthesis glycosyltransferase [Cyanobacterium sp. T60_A2020_053]
MATENKPLHNKTTQKDNNGVNIPVSNSFTHKISVIIPVLNEEKFLSQNLDKFSKKDSIEYIFVDGGSSDNTVNLIQSKALTILQCDVKNRALQMNLGAEKAQGDILLFLHGDSILPTNFDQEIITTLDTNKVIAGAFKLNINNQNNLLKFISFLVQIRSQYLSLPYGDQGIFLKKQTFQDIGMFKNMPIMEDFDLVKRLQKKGIIKMAEGAVITSDRRWKKLGIFKTTLINQLMILGYYLKIDINLLAKIYRKI